MCCLKTSWALSVIRAASTSILKNNCKSASSVLTLVYHRQYYVPPYNMVTSGFLKQILAGEKQLLKASEVKTCNPPRYDEISVTNLYEECI